MSTDRELLELAAKAAGLEYNGLWFDEHTGLLVWEPPTNYESRGWNPLTDDGDEARLEAKLGLDVMWAADHVDVVRQRADGGNLLRRERYADHNGDKQAARRCAGVMVAAELGRKS